MKMLEKLNAMRSHGGAVLTHGVDDETLLRFAQTDERLGIAVALGNATTSEAVIKALQSRRQHDSEVVREHVEWALANHIS